MREIGYGAVGGALLLGMVASAPLGGEGMTIALIFAGVTAVGIFIYNLVVSSVTDIRLFRARRALEAANRRAG